MVTSDGFVMIGKFEVSMERAVGWIASYTDADLNKTSVRPYAFPAYDQNNSVANQATVLVDADFLAPGLLNVPVKIRSFYALQRIRSELEAGLESPELAQPLAELGDARIGVLVGRLYSVLDDPEMKPVGVNATTLSKVLHRKRPASLALHDKWVRACYVGTDRAAQVPRAKHRSWAEYMTLVSRAMANDLRSQDRQFSGLQAVSKAAPRPHRPASTGHLGVERRPARHTMTESGSR